MKNKTKWKNSFGGKDYQGEKIKKKKGKIKADKISGKNVIKMRLFRFQTQNFAWTGAIAPPQVRSSLQRKNYFRWVGGMIELQRTEEKERKKLFKR